MYTIGTRSRKLLFSKFIYDNIVFLTFTKYKSYFFLIKAWIIKVTFVILIYYHVIFVKYKVTFLTLDCKIIFKIKITTFLFFGNLMGLYFPF